MSVVTVAQVKTHLNLSAAVNAALDAELQVFIDGCEAAIAQKTGPLTSVAKTERIRGGRRGLVLRHTPVIELTSVTPVGGSAYDVDDDLDLDQSAGVIELASGAFFPNVRFDVEYAAGRASVDPDLKLAILDFVRDNWKRSQRGAGTRPGGKPSETVANTVPGAAYSFSFAVMEKLAPHIQIGN